METCANSAASVPTAAAATILTARMPSGWDSSPPRPLRLPSGRPTRIGRGRQEQQQQLMRREMRKVMTVPSGGFQPPPHPSTAAAADAADIGRRGTDSVQLSAAREVGGGEEGGPAAAAAGSVDRQNEQEGRMPRSDLPTLFDIPPSIHPAYRPLPTPIRIGLAVLSASIAAASTYTKAVRRIARVGTASSGGVGGGDILLDQLGDGGGDWRRAFGIFVKFALRALLLGALTIASVQEAFLRPSRVDTTTLLVRGWLPSTLSRFDEIQTTIPTLGGRELGPLGVHYLRYDDPSDSVGSVTSPLRRFDVLHCNHGFGASSLSWLPSLPKLTDRLGAKVGIAHDAVGFGFTDRPKATRGKREDLVPYSLAASAALGTALVENALAEVASSNCSDEGAVDGKEDIEPVKAAPRSVALLGHSMGCTTTLRMALALPRDVRKYIVLVAPAIFPASEKEVASKRKGKLQDKLRPRGRIRRLVDKTIAAVRRIVLDLPFGYFLRRLVGKATFWMKSLRLVWGNPKGVTDADVLRFQWPAIGRGWEAGLLAFIRSRISGINSFPGGELAILEKVLSLPNTSVVVIAGGSDKIVPPSAARELAEKFSPQVRFLQLEGRGHDPFEEEIDEFASVVEALLEVDANFR